MCKKSLVLICLVPAMILVACGKNGNPFADDEYGMMIGFVE